MATFVKICGLSTPADVTAAVDAGADAVGFVFAESPRRVSAARAAELTRSVPASVVRVAVMRHPTQEEWDEVAAGFEPDWLQTDAGDFSGLQIDACVRRLPVYRDVPGLDSGEIGREQCVLFEANDSGVGDRVDWDKAARLAASTRLLLAGGLDPLNVAAAIKKVRPWGVDVSSGVERSHGEKDPDRIAAFVDAVRRLET
ncbi:MAG: phosphoribosylanthranilate isomerase [Gammaproteobacteria bacterium]